jgi:predicted O-linked N-acetylglucosamine transferase (SPINDLY family)
LIQGDQIDILIQIAGYVRNHRFDVLAHKPAPIQVVLGSLNTTGLRAMDYRFTDAWLDPREWDLPYVETSVYLSGGCLCYRPIQSPAQISVLPALKNRYVTFGAFHDHLKLNPLILSLWARILTEVDNSRLIIKCGGASDSGVVDCLLEKCRSAGMNTDRIQVIGWLPHGHHLSLYDKVDLMLDSFPFNGATMTLEALWMGVPTVSLAGDLFMTRNGYLILSQVGLEAFVADTPDAYVEKAIAFSQQWDALARIRAGLRQTMLASSLCNPHSFASEMAEAFRYMWYRWCSSQGTQVPQEEPAGLFVDS